MKRRTLLQQAMTLAGLSLSSAAEPVWKLRYMLASSMYGNLPLAEVVAQTRAGGASSIELWPRKHGTQREELDQIGEQAFVAMLKQHQVGFGGSTRYDLGPFQLTAEMDVVARLGGKLIITGGAGEYKGLSPAQLKSNVLSFVEKMRPHAAKAAELGIVIGIENHVNNLIDSPDSLRWLADASRKVAGLGIALAPYHLPQDSALLSDLIAHAADKLALFYAWEHGMGCMKPMPKEEELQQMPGRGPLDWKPVLQALRRINFQGPTEIFMHPTPRGIPILPTAAETTAEIQRARSFLDGLVAQLNS
jgi:sugar phosphate isomerase/epimerase